MTTYLRALSQKYITQIADLKSLPIDFQSNSTVLNAENEMYVHISPLELLAFFPWHNIEHPKDFIQSIAQKK